MRKRDNDKLSPVASEPISATNQLSAPDPHGSLPVEVTNSSIATTHTDRYLLTIQPVIMLHNLLSKELPSTFAY